MINTNKPTPDNVNIIRSGRTKSILNHWKPKAGNCAYKAPAYSILLNNFSLYIYLISNTAENLSVLDKGFSFIPLPLGMMYEKLIPTIV